MKFKDLFLLSWKKFGITIIIFIVFFFFSNVWARPLKISGSLLSSAVSILIFIYLLICAIYSLIKQNKTKKRKKKVKQNIFIISWKKFGILLISWVVSVVIHNFGSALIGFEEPVFFLIAVIVIPLYFIISIIYSIIHYFWRKK